MVTSIRGPGRPVVASHGCASCVFFGSWYARAYQLVVAAVAVWSRWCSGSGARRGISPASGLMEGRDVLESRF